MYRLLDMYGSNIVVSEGDEWKRFRKIANPGFSEVRAEFFYPLHFFG
jgi:cytochrome P450